MVNFLANILLLRSGCDVNRQDTSFSRTGHSRAGVTESALLDGEAVLLHIGDQW